MSTAEKLADRERLLDAIERALFGGHYGADRADFLARINDYVDTIRDLREALARERGGGSPLDRAAYIDLHRRAGLLLAKESA